MKRDARHGPPRRTTGRRRRCAPAIAAPKCPRETTAAFLLAALNTQERNEFVIHLQTCHLCDTEIESLLPVLRMLDILRDR